MKRYIFYFSCLLLWISGEAQTIQVNDSVIHPICHDASNGAIILEITGANPPFTILWSNGASTKKIYGLDPGNYSVTLSDQAGNQHIENFSLNNPSVPVLNFTASPVSLFGSQDGEIQAVLLSPDAGFSYAWSNGSSTLNQTNLTAGRYNLKITDSLGCTYDTSVYLNSPVPAEFHVYKTNDSTIYRFAESVQVNLDGLTPPYGSLIGLFFDSLGTSVCRGFTHFQPGMKEIVCYGGEGLDVFEHLDVLVYNPNLQTTISCRAGWNTYYHELLYKVVNTNPIQVVKGYEQYYQEKQLIQGNGLFCLTVKPTENSLDVLFGSNSNFQYLKDETGSVYWPQYNINSVGSLEVGKGYITKCSTATSIQIPGTYLYPENIPIFVKEGWSIFPYLSGSSYSNYPHVFMPNTTPIQFLKSSNGGIYWPLYGLNLINVIPGEAYEILMSSPYVYFFPPSQY